jgi:hypothetical protein
LAQFSSFATEDPLPVQDVESDIIQEPAKDTNELESEELLTVLTATDVDLDQVIQEDDGSNESDESEYESD